MIDILTGDCRDVLKTMQDCSVHCCVTSPPYFGLRDYGCAGQIGLESSPDAYVSELVAVFREVKRVLRDDGTCWLNLGDSYCGYKGENYCKNPETSKLQSNNHIPVATTVGTPQSSGYKNKDLFGIPWRVAFALQSAGWYLRQDIIWHKPNPMPESVTDRCTKAHEYIFLLSKSPRYYYDAEAVAEPVAQATIERLGQATLPEQYGSTRVPGKTNGNMKAVPPRFGGSKYGDNDADEHRTKSGNAYDCTDGKRNRRSVWTVTTKPYKGAHFATFPPDLIRPCILAGCPQGGTVIDPFGGSGTTGEVCEDEGRNSILIELNPEYVKLAKRRTAQAGLFCTTA